MDPISPHPHTPQKDQMSLQELIRKMKEITAFLCGKKYVLIGFTLLGMVLGLVYSLVKKPTYIASLSFVMADQGSTGLLGAYSGIAAQLGIDLGNNSNDLFQGDNIMEFIKSQHIVSQALLSEVLVGGKKELLVDRYIDAKGIREQWKKGPLANFSFQPGLEENLVQDSLLMAFHEDILDHHLKVSKPDKKLNIIVIQTETTDRFFAKYFTEQLIQNVTDFYIRTRTKKSQTNLNVLTRQVDSVRRELNSALGGAAMAADANPNANLAMRRLNVPSQRKTVDVQANTAILTELVKSQELARITLRNDMPIIQVIDRPKLPLKEHHLGKIKGIVLGGLIFGFISFFVLTARYLLSTLYDNE